MKYFFKISAFVLLLIVFFEAKGQYFGKNKVQYEEFPFTIYQTPHFDIYNYVGNEESIERLGQLSERWYLRHQAVFLDTFHTRNPVIIYNNHAEFQQNTVIESLIGVGTGGVTEGLKNRVVQPFSSTHQATNHVLGHELVHAFQYNLIKKSDSTSLQSIGNLPLWMVEGLAEYLSIGSVSPNTAMWLRDAMLHDDIPTFKDLTNKPGEYFPYRYGHAFWAFITGTWGDSFIQPLFMNTATRGYERAMDTLFGYSAEELSKMWENTIKRTYQPYLDNTIDVIGEPLFTSENFGDRNLSPVLSPDGESVVFLSDRNVINIGIYLARVEDRKIIKKLTHFMMQGHVDDYNFIESKGSWSPDGERYVFSTFVRGDNKLFIVNARKGKKIREMFIPGVESFDDPSWSPDGNSILVSGLVGGDSDLYLFNLNTKEVENITDDVYSDIQPSWSPDGRYVAFVTDRGPETNINIHKYGSYRIGIKDLQTGNIETLNFFPGANNVSPQFSADGESIYFLSDRDGFRNLYQYDIASRAIYQLTKYFTGISGITELSPALSVSQDRVAYSIYSDDGYSIYTAGIDEFPREPVNPKAVDMTPARLPSYGRAPRKIVDENLERYPLTTGNKFSTKDPRFSLEYIGNTSVGVGTSRFGGTSMAGGVSAIFSDILKENQLFTAAQVYGEIYDAGGQVAYLNRQNTLNWGVSFSHIPYRASRAFLRNDTLTFEDGEDQQEIPVQNLVLETQRTFEDQLTLFSQYPLSRRLRFEGGISATHYGYRIDSVNNYYTLFGNKIAEDRQKIDAPDGFYLMQANLAFVGDNSLFGLTSPLNGFRYRFQVDRMFGEWDIYNVLADYRKYFFEYPFSFAFRGVHYARYGKDAGDLYPLYVGSQYYVRGYSINDVRSDQCIDGNCLDINGLTGTRMAIANFEARLPLTGPARLALIKSGFLFSDFVLFTDAGLAWTKTNDIEFSWEPVDGAHTPIISTGLAMRINLFGYAIVEPYLAIPWQREKTTAFGLFLSSGGW